MAQAVIGALRVNLGMNSAQFSKGLKKADSGLKRFANAAKIGLAAVSAAAGVVSVAIMRVADDADHMAKTAVQIGVSVEELSRLRHAADLSGVGMNELANGMKRLSLNMYDASKGVGQGADAFKDLGIKVKNSDGSLKSTTQVMTEMSAVFAKMKDGSQKTALAMRLMGKSGAGMIPMLNGGTAALQSMLDEADALGIVISSEMAGNAELFNDNLTRMQKAAGGVAITLVTGVLPALAELSTRMVASMQGSTALKDATAVLSGAFNILVKGIIVVFDNLGHLFDLFKLFVAAKTVTFIVAVTGAFITMAKGIRVAGLALALYNAIQRRGLATFVVIAGVLAKVTGYYDDFASTLKNLYAEAKSFIPKELTDGAEKLVTDLKDLAFGTEDAAKSLSTYMNAADGAAASFGNLSSVSKSAGSLAKSSVDSASDAWKGLRVASEDATKSMVAGMEGFGNKAGGIITGLFNKTLTWKDALGQALSSFAQMQLNSYNPVSQSGGFLKGLLGSVFGGFRANGGPVSSGKSYMVGERGPEMFSPSVSGNITANDNMGGGGMVYAPVTSIDARGADQAAVARLEQKLTQMQKTEYQRFLTHSNNQTQRKIR